jgi:hypothetical protein
MSAYLAHLVDVISHHWVYGLCSIVVTVLSLVVLFCGVFRWLYRMFPRDQSEEFSEPDVQNEPPAATTLKAKHCESPEDFGFLKGSLVKVTGFVARSAYDGQPPYLELYPFPFSVDADVRCEFPPEMARKIRDLPFRKLLSVVGTAEDGLHAPISSYNVRLTLKNCRIVKPAFSIWLRYLWHDFKMTLRYALHFL